MKLIRVSFAPSRASLCFVNGGASPFSVPKAVSFNSRSFSACSFCRILHQNNIASDGVNFLAISNNCISRFCSTHNRHVGSLTSGRNDQHGISRTFSTFVSPLISPTPSLIIRSPSSAVVAAHLNLYDAPQRSDEWFALRKDKLTTSTFSTALGFWKGNRRFELWNEKVFAAETQIMEASKFAMQWGVLNEAAAVDRYKSITGREVSSLGFAIHREERLHWLGASPDGLLDCFPEGGILEVKCPYNKGKPETGLPWSTMPYYYMPQVQGQMEIMDRDWVDLYCWTPNGSTIFRVNRERGYWDLVHGILREFWWEHVVPGREALLLGNEEKAKSYIPNPKHGQTGLAVYRSIKLASEAKLLCREIAGHIEFYS
ncbi:hypothetical protein FEM48_Zijuj10G0039200 [Ziziphus jujuba var. spinosa]|uniref:YqaJ viral recombinase domain-containing protein n=1 Tax=Ziziphus jujuba var. spinosa TaxID=714518 RepID=A0A978UL53_ZIZJJ|nr:hypothetical protein FEM48_Zijuj10G0039200 [Ziziphus jujuba var. spinosa]